MQSGFNCGGSVKWSRHSKNDSKIQILHNQTRHFSCNMSTLVTIIIQLITNLLELVHIEVTIRSNDEPDIREAISEVIFVVNHVNDINENRG